MGAEAEVAPLAALEGAEAGDAAAGYGCTTEIEDGIAGAVAGHGAETEVAGPGSRLQQRLRSSWWD